MLKIYNTSLILNTCILYTYIPNTLLNIQKSEIEKMLNAKNFILNTKHNVHSTYIPKEIPERDSI